MIHHEETTHTIGISNDDFLILFDYSRGVSLKSWESTKSPGNGPQVQPRRLFHLDMEGTVTSSTDFAVLDVTGFCDGIRELVSLRVRYPAAEDSEIEMRISLIGNRDNSMELLLQMRAVWRDEIPKEIHLGVDFLQDPTVWGDGTSHLFPAEQVRKEKGGSLFRQHMDFPMPLGIFDPSGRRGFSIHLPTQFPFFDNENGQVNRIRNRQELESLQMLCKPHSTMSDILDMRIVAVEDGWTEYFEDWRNQARRDYRLELQRRPDLAWYGRTFLHHFTYLFGKEAYDGNRDRIDAEGLMRQGEAFGGYDVVLLWQHYPRLGLDPRSQWDFFEDSPGGSAGLKEAVETFHRHGTRVFLPYKPWDLGNTESVQTAAGRMADLVREYDVDGFFLDTMSGIPASFQEEADKVRPGIVFCAEIQPREKKNIERLTGSWDQYGGSSLEIDIDLFRFVLPELPQHVISRWSVGTQKDKMIRRAVFNGSGIVIWQDVFGAWLPFDEWQKELIRRWKEIMRKEEEAFRGSRPMPHFPTRVSGVYCNRFVSDDGRKTVYTLYNDNAHPVDGEILQIEAPGPLAIEEIWQGRPAFVEMEGKLASIRSSIGSKDIIVLCATR